MESDNITNLTLRSLSEFHSNVPSFGFLHKIVSKEVNLVSFNDNLKSEVKIPYPYNVSYGLAFIETARQLFQINEPTRVYLKKLEVMCNCTTNPFRVTLGVNKSDDVSFYLKDGNPKRAFGIKLYNYLLNRDKIKFITDGNSLAMEEIKGDTLEDLEYRKFTKCQCFYENLTRLEVFLNLALLNDISCVTNRRNIVIHGKNINVIDFDQTFTLGNYDFNSTRNMLGVRKYFDIKDAEKLAIWNNYQRNKKNIDAILSGIHINQELANMMGYDYIGEVVKHRLESFRAYSR